MTMRKPEPRPKITTQNEQVQALIGTTVFTGHYDEVRERRIVAAEKDERTPWLDTLYPYDEAGQPVRHGLMYPTRLAALEALQARLLTEISNSEQEMKSMIQQLGEEHDALGRVRAQIEAL